VPAKLARPAIAGAQPTWRHHTEQSAYFSYYMLDWILTDGHHISAVEGEGIKRLLSKAEPRFQPPSRKYFSQASYLFQILNAILFFVLIQSLIPHIYKQAKSLQKTLLHGLTLPGIPPSTSSSSSSCSPSKCSWPHYPFSCTTDGWSGRDHESYYCITVHYFSETWCLCKQLLDIKLCEDRHTGDNLRQWIGQTLDENDLDVSQFFSFCMFHGLAFDSVAVYCLQGTDCAAITHDHGSDISLALQLSPWHDIICFDHELDCTVNAGIDVVHEFQDIFMWANNVVHTISASNNLYRTLRTEQVCNIFFCLSVTLNFHLSCHLFCR